MKDKNYLVFGAGISGIGSVQLLSTVTENITLYDGNKELDKEALREKVGVDIKFDIVTGVLPDEVVKATDITVLSPGVPPSNPDVMRLKAAGARVWGEVELAYRFNRGKILAITGTNGKTTTTSLVGEICALHTKDTFVTGNIGVAYTTCAPKTTDNSLTVLEISSFQLETTVEFHSQVSAILNITPDHLDRHGTFENYAQAKYDITKNQTEDDTIVLNYDDPLLKGFGERSDLRPKVIFFSSSEILDKGLYLKGKEFYYNDGAHEVFLLRTDEMKLLGRHNYENVMAAIGICLAAGIPQETIIKGVKGFNAVEHRIEFVVEKNGVRYYNDSKGTNPDAAIKAVEAMERPTILIGGGYDKNSDYEEWIGSFGDKVKLLVLIGQTREKIRDAAERCGFTHTVLCDTFEEAVETCIKAAKPGDAVLLSPACASWGMFKNYEERGRIFKELVRK
ncbi:MAG: UDP-N-acetylmuramoyl-L-alanine--D-glutamate ligase [Lachnospiraceae bacterium]|nr:UDP-N-acetylmuramoyl-L-alanine--D-glutamate ligase [Lachnospiraceae bacterium]